MNTLVYFAGTEILSWVVPVVVALNVAAFTVMIVRASRHLWALDFEANVDGAPR